MAPRTFKPENRDRGLCDRFRPFFRPARHPPPSTKNRREYGQKSITCNRRNPFRKTCTYGSKTNFPRLNIYVRARRQLPSTIEPSSPPAYGVRDPGIAVYSRSQAPAPFSRTIDFASYSTVAAIVNIYHFILWKKR